VKEQAKAKKTFRREFWEWIKSLAVAFVLAMLIRQFFFQAFKIPSSSMEPTLQVGDHLIANKLVYRFREPARGDVLIFRFRDPQDRLAPADDGRLLSLFQARRAQRDLVKRIVGLPGETIRILDGRIYVNGELAPDERLKTQYYYDESDSEFAVPEKHYFVLGDNSKNSYDSRYWGFVPRENLLGNALFLYWPPNRWGIIR
jgi:signal peptidase I